jgi:hypothetical protein
MIKKILITLDSKDFFSKILVSSLVFYYYKTAFWPLTYLFILTYVLIVFIFLRKFSWNLSLRDYFSNFITPCILAAIIILAYLMYGPYSNIIILKDILLIIVLFSHFYFLYWSKKILGSDLPVSFIYELIVILTTFICISNLVIQIFPSLLPSSFLRFTHISNGSSIAEDYNFFSLFILFGLIILNYENQSNIFAKKLTKVSINALNILYILNILLSGSRRGIAALIVLVFIFIIYQYIRKTREHSRKFSLSRFINIAVFLFILLAIGFAFWAMVPEKIVSAMSRYSIFTGDGGLRQVERLYYRKSGMSSTDKKVIINKNSFDKYSYIWTSAASGSELSAIETEFGKGLKISRDKGDTGGFSLYYTGPRIIYYANHTYKTSFKIKLISGDFNSFNIGWWVNDGEKGFGNAIGLKKEFELLEDGWYLCTSKYTFIDNHYGLMSFINSVSDNASFIISDFELIDLDSDPDLPRYVFEIENNANIISLLDSINAPWLSTNLINNGDFEDDLEYWNSSPDTTIKLRLAEIDGKKCAHIRRSDGDGGAWSLYYNGRNIEYWANNEYQISFKVRMINSNTLPFNVGFWVNEGFGYQIGLSCRSDELEDGWWRITAKYLFRNNYKNLMFPFNSQIDNSEFYITDISLVNITQRQFQPPPSSDFNAGKGINFPDRVERWSYGLTLWANDYKWHQKLFGKGFVYLNLYGQKFNFNLSDWPHNPFISILLYSGLVGLLVYIWLLIRVVKLYYIYRKSIRIHFICFLLTFFFSFFSGSSPFDPPIMGFFILLPFFILSINTNLSDNIITSKI